MVSAINQTSFAQEIPVSFPQLPQWAQISLFRLFLHPERILCLYLASGKISAKKFFFYWIFYFRPVYLMNI